MSLNQRELVMNALAKGPKGERPPVANPTSIACHGLMDATGASFPEAHLDVSAMVDLAWAGHEIAGFDAVMPEFSVVQEAAADSDTTRSVLFKVDLLGKSTFFSCPPIHRITDCQKLDTPRIRPYSLV